MAQRYQFYTQSGTRALSSGTPNESLKQAFEGIHSTLKTLVYDTQDLQTRDLLTLYSQAMRSTFPVKNQVGRIVPASQVQLKTETREQHLKSGLVEALAGAILIGQMKLDDVYDYLDNKRSDLIPKN